MQGQGCSEHVLTHPSNNVNTNIDIDSILIKPILNFSNPAKVRVLLQLQMVVDSTIFNIKSECVFFLHGFSLGILPFLDSMLVLWDLHTAYPIHPHTPSLCISSVGAFRLRLQMSDEMNGRFSKIYGKGPLRQISLFYRANHHFRSIYLYVDGI